MAETAQKVASNKAAQNGEEKVPRKVAFEYSGDRFVIPSDMDLTEAIAALTRQQQEEAVVVNVMEPVMAFPLDGAAALMKVLQKRYGWQNLMPDHHWWGSTPPTMISVEIAPGQRVQVPWGNMSVPKVDGKLMTGWTLNENTPIFQLGGSVKRMHERLVAEIAAAVRQEVLHNSIYRGQAIKINYRDAGGNRKDFDPAFAPKFIDLAEVGDEAIFSTKIEKQLEINLYNPVRHTDMCRQNGISLKLLNVVDGIESKAKDQGLMVVLTTNNINAINTAFIRPGRMDAIIEIMPPDAQACVRIVRKYATEGGCVMTGSDADVVEAIKVLVGANAAFFRVVVEMAKLSAISQAVPTQPVVISPADLKVAADSMLMHARLLNPRHGEVPLHELPPDVVHDPLNFALSVLMRLFVEEFFDMLETPQKLTAILTNKEIMAPRKPAAGTQN
jgi:SpoVK/Ycf46/Vps4 family AAA+-type ATPase